MNKAGLQKKQIIIFIAGILAFVIGFGVLSVYGFRKISREIHRQKLLKENVVIEIPELNIKAPVLEGTDNNVLYENQSL